LQLSNLINDGIHLYTTDLDYSHLPSAAVRSAIKPASFWIEFLAHDPFDGRGDIFWLRQYIVLHESPGDGKIGRGHPLGRSV
jgi:hypothetical protein